MRRFTELNAPHALHRHRTVTRSPSPGTFTSPARPLGGTRPAGREGSGARRGGRLQPGRPEPATRRPLACGEPSPASKCIRATPPRRGTRTGPRRDAPHLTALLANSVGPPARTRLGEAGTGRRGVAGWAPAPCASSFPYKNINALFSVKLGFGFRLLSSSTWNNTDSERVFIKSRNRTKHTAYM